MKDGHISVAGVVLNREIGQSTDPCARISQIRKFALRGLARNYTIIFNRLVGVEL